MEDTKTEEKPHVAYVKAWNGKIALKCFGATINEASDGLKQKIYDECYYKRNIYGYFGYPTIDVLLSKIVVEDRRNAVPLLSILMESYGTDGKAIRTRTPIDCDASCYYAHMNKCTCPCNGLNHGKGWERAYRNTVQNWDKMLDGFLSEIKNSENVTYGAQYKRVSPSQTEVFTKKCFSKNKKSAERSALNELYKNMDKSRGISYITLQKGKDKVHTVLPRTDMDCPYHEKGHNMSLEVKAQPHWTGKFKIKINWKTMGYAAIDNDVSGLQKLDMFNQRMGFDAKERLESIAKSINVPIEDILDCKEEIKGEIKDLLRSSLEIVG